MKQKLAIPPESPNERYKDAITRSIDEKIRRLEARARPRAGENDDTAAARARWLQYKAELTELEVRRRRNELVEVREIAQVISSVLINLRQMVSYFPARIIPELNPMLEIKPELLPVVRERLKHFTHSWLIELSKLAEVTAADAYARYKAGEDDDRETEERTPGARGEKERRKDEKRTRGRGATKEG